MRWHFLVSPPLDGAHNMAVDQALMLRAARTGDGVLRMYSWSRPTLSLGRNQRARDCYDTERARSMGIDFLRRPTGGRALLHHHEVTYSVTVPLVGTRARAMYDFINGVLLDGLRGLGVEAGLATSSAPVTPGLRPCFDVPTRHEIVLGTRKLVGSAQWWRDGALLQHGSILVRDDQPLIARLLKVHAGNGTSAATLSGALGREPSFVEVADALTAALGATIESEVRPLSDEGELAADIARLRRDYDNPGWTWRL